MALVFARLSLTAHVLFYRPLEGTVGIELARVLHGARDLDAIFAPDEG